MSAGGRFKAREARLPLRYRDHESTEPARKPNRVRAAVRTSDARPETIRTVVPRKNQRGQAVSLRDAEPEARTDDRNDLELLDDDYFNEEVDDSPDYVGQTFGRLAAIAARQQLLDPRRPGGALSRTLKANLRNLKNMLKLPKARTFVFCEFFYSAVDRQIFLEENEFRHLLKDSFPNIKTLKLRLPEWREIRRLVGKPRRFSPLFLKEERKSLDFKRKKIRQIYQGQCLNLPPDHDLPKLLPRQMDLGVRVYARIRMPKDGVYAGTIDAILNDGYRVTFEKEEMIPPMVVPDCEVMPESTPELFSINYFIEMNNATDRNNFILPSSVLRPSLVLDLNKGPGGMLVGAKVLNASAGGQTLGMPQPTLTGGYPTSGFATTGFNLQTRPGSGMAGGSLREFPWQKRDDRVGNFPLRMLVIMVKLFKVLDHKKSLVLNLQWMNDRAERMNMVVSGYPRVFQERYAEILAELDIANRLLESYLNGIAEYNELLVTNLNDPVPADRPDQLRKQAQAHARQLVKHCNHALQVKNPTALDVISRLTSIMLQIRQLGSDKRENTHYELSVLGESLNQLKASLSAPNVRHFQDCVEVHMKQIFLMTSKRKII